MTDPQTRTALVTGASRGIGRAIAVRLAADGFLVIVHYHQAAHAAAGVVADIETRGGMAFTVQADFRTLAGADALLKAADDGLARLGLPPELDVLVNNAGIPLPCGIEETTEAAFDEMLAINLMAPFFLAQRALPRLRDGGRIINISSGTSQIALPEEAAYAMAKAALNSFTRSLAKLLGERGITVNAIGPGITETDFQGEWLSDPQAREFAASISAFSRLGVPEDVAGVAAFLASDDARFITGAYIDASGGSLLG